MGLLDDAIREHLELKKRHGADPTEVARQEREAFGPVRGPGAPLPADDDADRLDDVHALDDEPFDDDPRTPGPVASPPEPEPEPEPIAEPPVAETPPRAEGGAVSLDRFAPGDDVEVDWTDPRPTAAEPAEGTGAEAPGEGDEAGEDVLDQTPEFLSETPEHDRLWFEQRPPRDFDF